MKKKFRILGHLGLAVFLVSALLLTAVPLAKPVYASSVSSVWVDFPSSLNINDGSGSTDLGFRVNFTPATALKRGVDTITIWVPDGSSAMGPVAFDLASLGTTKTDFLVNATAIIQTPSFSTTGFRITLLTPVDLAADVATHVEILVGAQVASLTSSSTLTYKMKVYTSKDTTPVETEAFHLGEFILGTKVELTLSPDTAGLAGRYTLLLDNTGGGSQIDGGDTVTVIFPVGTTMPSSIDGDDVTWSDDNGGSWSTTSVTPVVNQGARMVTVTVPITLIVHATDNLLRFGTGALILNPQKAETNLTGMFVFTNDKELMLAETGGYNITAGTLTKIIVADGEIGLGGGTKPYSDNASMINSLSSEIFVTLADEYGNAKAPATAKTVTMSTSGTGVFYINDQDVPGSGAYSAATSLSVDADDPTFAGQQAYYRGSVAETVTLTFSHASYNDATWTFTVAPAVSLYDSSSNLIQSFGPPTGTGSTTVSELGSGSGIGNIEKYGVDYINDAITASVAGDTVKLGDGIYELDAEIALDQAITLTSVNDASSTTLRNTTNIQKAIWVKTDGTATNPIIIDGFTFQRLRSGVDIFRGVYNKSRNYVTVRNNIFNSIQPDVDKDNATPGGVIVFWIDGSPTAITSATVSNNTINNSLTAWSGGAKAGNIVFNVGPSAGSTNMIGVTISNNTITNSLGYGIVVGAQRTGSYVTANIKDNTITNGMSPIVLDWNTKDVKVTGNTVTGGYNYGIRVEGAGIHPGTVIKNNTITGAAGAHSRDAAVVIDEDGVTLQYNAIYDNDATYSIKVASDKSVDAEYNWYGSASGPGTSVSGTATTTPWLHKPLADVVADNAAYIAQKISLGVGLHTLSTPALLITTADSIDELMPDYATTMEYAYKFVNGVWSSIGTDALTPGSAYYIKMTVADSMVLKYAANEYYTPSKDLVAGWNLISLASLSDMLVDDSVASVKLTAAGLPGYSQVISPSLNDPSWSFSVGSDPDAKKLVVGEGYWIYMQNSATLAGFTIFPFVPDLD